MTEKEYNVAIVKARDYWFNQSGSYPQEEIMIDSFMEGYKQAIAVFQ